MNQQSFPLRSRQSGSAIMAVLFIIALMGVTIGTVFTLTNSESRFMKRSVDREVATAYADGVLETLYDQWRLGLSNTQDPTQHASGFTYNELMSGTATAPSTTVPSPLPLTAPSATNFPAPAGCTLTSWSVTPADPFLAPVTNHTTRPTPETGTNSRMRSRTYYLAQATVAFRKGTVTIQRAFVRAGRNIFDNFLFSTQPVTEIHPGAPMYVNGTVYVGGNLYTGTNNLHFQQDVTYTGNWSIGYAPNDPHASTPSSPTWPTGNAPHSGAQQKLLDTAITSLDPNFIDGINTNDVDSDKNVNNDGYHELIEELVTPVSTKGADALQIDTDGTSERLASNADYRIYIDDKNVVTIYKGTAALTAGTDFTAIMNAITTNTALFDGREGDYVRTVNIDVGKLTTAVNASPSTFDTAGQSDGLLLYIQDKSVGTSVKTQGVSGYTVGKKDTSGNNISNYTTTGGTQITSNTHRGIRLVNGGKLPDMGLTVATPNPIYIQGDYNTGTTTDYSTSTTSTASILPNLANTPPSDVSSAYPSGTSAPVEISGSYTKKASAIAADAVTILSNNWADGKSNTNKTSDRVPTNTTINTAIVSGNVPTATTGYSGGIENYPRLLENWTSNTGGTGSYLTIHGSFGLLYDSEQGLGVWNGSYYGVPSRRWFYDTLFQDKNPPGFPAAFTYGRGPWAAK